MKFDFMDMSLGCDDDSPKVDVEVDIDMVEPPEAEDPINGNPGWPAVYEVKEVRLIRRLHNLLGVELTTLTLSEQEFGLFFSQGEDILNNAYEWASSQEN